MSRFFVNIAFTRLKTALSRAFRTNVSVGTRVRFWSGDRDPGGSRSFPGYPSPWPMLFLGELTGFRLRTVNVMLDPRILNVFSWWEAVPSSESGGVEGQRPAIRRVTPFTPSALVPCVQQKVRDEGTLSLLLVVPSEVHPDVLASTVGTSGTPPSLVPELLRWPLSGNPSFKRDFRTRLWAWRHGRRELPCSYMPAYSETQEFHAAMPV